MFYCKRLVPGAFNLGLIGATCTALPSCGSGTVPSACVTSASDQGLTLVHFSAQPEPLLFTEATASVHFSAQPETFLPEQPLSIAHTTCSRRAEKWTLVAQKKRLVELRSGGV